MGAGDLDEREHGQGAQETKGGGDQQGLVEAAFGFRAPTWLWLSVRPSELAATGEAFAGFAEVAYAVATTGASNLAVCAVCRDEEEFYDFLTIRVGSLRAVDRVETSPIIRTLKQSSSYPP